MAQAHKDSAGIQLLYLDQLVRAGRPEDAESHLRGLIGAGHKLAVYYAKLADVIQASSAKKTGAKPDSQAYEAARKVIQTGLEKLDDRKERAALMHKMAEVFELQGDWASAANQARQIVKEFPDAALSWVRLGECLVHLKEYDEALASTRKAVEIDPSQFTAWNNMAWILAVQKRDLGQARLYAQNALRLSPDHPMLLDTAAWVEYQLGDADRAIELLERSVKTFEAANVPVSAVVRYHLGMAYKLRLDKAAADADRKRARDEAVKNLKAYLQGEPSGEHAAEAQKLLKDLEGMQ